MNIYFKEGPQKQEICINSKKIINGFNKRVSETIKKAMLNMFIYLCSKIYS